MIDNPTEALRGVVLAFADDEHMIGSRHANWIGLGPFLEEDLAFCSIAQDELGHALALYDLIVPSDQIDRFALLRHPSAYRSCTLAELECASWDLALVRHWLYDRAEQLRWQALRHSSVPELAGLARQVDREEAFHRSHARMYLERITADPEAKERVRRALALLAPDATSLWAPPDYEPAALAEGITDTSSDELAAAWRSLIEADRVDFGLDDVGVELTAPPTPRTARSPGFDEFHASLGEVISLDPAAVW